MCSLNGIFMAGYLTGNQTCLRDLFLHFVSRGPRPSPALAKLMTDADASCCSPLLSEGQPIALWLFIFCSLLVVFRVMLIRWVLGLVVFLGISWYFHANNTDKEIVLVQLTDWVFFFCVIYSLAIIHLSSEHFVSIFLIWLLRWQLIPFLFISFIWIYF